MQRRFEFKRGQKICPECNGSEFKVSMVEGLFEHPLYLRHRLLHDSFSIESNKTTQAIYCTNCGLIISGMTDVRTEVNWKQSDIFSYFIDGVPFPLLRQVRHIVFKKINKIRDETPHETFQKLCSMPLSKAVVSIQEMMIRMELNDDSWREIIH